MLIKHVSLVFKIAIVTIIISSCTTLYNGKLIYARGYGMANLEFNIPVTPSTNFDIGSISKQFVAASIVLLMQQGKLNLDDDIRSHIPELPDFGHRITIDHLIHHTGGIKGFLDVSGLKEYPFQQNYLAPNDPLSIIINHCRELLFVPGEKFNYSNSGYFILGEIIKRVSGKPLAVYLKENIFKPPGMKNTFLGDNYQEIINRKSDSFYKDHKGVMKKVHHHHVPIGAGGVTAQ